MKCACGYTALEEQEEFVFRIWCPVCHIQIVNVSRTVAIAEFARRVMDRIREENERRASAIRIDNARKIGAAMTCPIQDEDISVLFADEILLHA